MAGAPVKRVIGTLLFTIALILTLGFVFLLFAHSERITDLPLLKGDEQDQARLEDAGLVVAIALAVIALLLIILLIVRRLDRRAERAAAAEAYYIPEEDRQAMLGRKRELFDEAFAGGPGPAPTPPNVKVYYLPLVPLADKKKMWGEPEPARQGNVWPLYFPRSVQSGVYVNDYLPIDRKGNRLKLRTLLAGIEEFPEVGSDAARKHEEELNRPKPEPVPPVPAAPPAPPTPPAPPPAALKEVGGRTEQLPSDRFIRELEQRMKAAPKEAPVPVVEDSAYYDFPGDNHFIEEVEGIGPVYGERLRKAGVHTTARLCFEDPMELSLKIDVPTKTVRTWQATAELMKVKGIGPQFSEALARAGIGGIHDLKKLSAAGIADQVNTYLNGLQATVTKGGITERRVQAWQESAKDLRRVRMKVPEQ